MVLLWCFFGILLLLLDLLDIFGIVAHHILNGSLL